MRIKAQALAPMVGLLLVSACGSDTSTGISGDPSGSYDLTLINNVSPPYTYNQDATTTDRLIGGNFTLNADGTFTQTLDFDETIVGEGTTQDSSTCTGTFTQNGGVLSFNETATTDQACGGPYNGSWDGENTLVFSLFNGASLTYVKS